MNYKGLQRITSAVLSVILCFGQRMKAFATVVRTTVESGKTVFCAISFRHNLLHCLHVVSIRSRDLQLRLLRATVIMPATVEITKL